MTRIKTGDLRVIVVVVLVIAKISRITKGPYRIHKIYITNSVTQKFVISMLIMGGTSPLL